MSQRVLVVSTNQVALRGALDRLTDAGFTADGAASFQEANRKIRDFVPHVLIADERLADFNGLHLVLRGHAVAPDMRAIITTPKRDPVLESDARRLNAVCVVTAGDGKGWLDPVCPMLNAPLRLSA